MTTPGMKRARELAATAVADYKQRKKAALARAVTWHWATKQTQSLEPGWFECHNIQRGRRLTTGPKKTGKANYQAEEGFDAQGRLVAVTEYTNQWDSPYEWFYFYEADGIVGIRYVSPKHLGFAQWIATDGDKVTTIDTVHPSGWRSKVYRLDAKGHYAGFSDIGTYDDKAIDQPFDIECNADGKIVRTWWVYPHNGKRAIQWEHSSVKGKKPKAAKARRRPEGREARRRDERPRRASAKLGLGLGLRASRWARASSIERK